MDNKLADVISRVQKLLNVANRSDKPGEVAAAQQLAQKLITKYQIEEALLYNHKSSGDIISKRIETPTPYAISKSMLLHAIAKHNFCKVLRGDTYCMIYGYTNDIDLCLALYELLLIHMIVEMKYKLEIAKEQAFEDVNTKAWIKAFFTGYAITISERIELSKSEIINETGQSDTSIAIVIRDKQHAIEEFYQSLERIPSSNMILSSDDGYREGKRSGQKANLNQTNIERE